MGACACLPCGPWRPWAAQETAPEPQEPAPEPEPPWAAALGARVAQLEAAREPWQGRAAQLACDLRILDGRLMQIEDVDERVDRLADSVDRLAQRVADIELPGTP